MAPAVTRARCAPGKIIQQAWLVTATATVDGEVGDTISLIPLAGDVRWRDDRIELGIAGRVLAFGPARV